MSEPWLPADHGSEMGGLQKRVARGLTWTLVDTWGSQLLGLVVFVILARLLTPADFGLVALAAVFVSFANLIVDQGLGDALIQRRSLTRRQIDTAFWAAVATGALLSVIALLLSEPIALLLGEPRLTPILRVLSLTFVLAALSSIQMALLRREMAFRSLAVRRITAVVGAGAVGVTMAFLGFGAWALVGQLLSAAAITVVMLWAVSPWRPSRHASRADFRELLGYGIHVVAGDMLNFLSRNMDNLLIGVFLGTTSLGFYAVAYRLLDTSQQLLVNAARKLAFPVFSRLQHDPQRLVRAYLRVSRAVSVVILPGYVGLTLVAQEAVVVIFGQRWEASGPVAGVLFLIGPVLTVQLFSGAVLNAVGHPEVTLRIRLVTTIFNVAGFLVAVALFRDIVAVAAAYTFRGYVVTPLILYWLRKYAGIPIAAHLNALRSTVIATGVMALAVLAVKFVLAASVSNAVLLLAEVVTGVATFSLAILIIDRPLVAEFLGFFLQAVPGGERIARRMRLPLPEPGPGKRGGRRAAGSSGVEGDEGVETDEALIDRDLDRDADV